MMSSKIARVICSHMENPPCCTGREYPADHLAFLTFAWQRSISNRGFFILVSLVPKFNRDITLIINYQTHSFDIFLEELPLRCR